MELVLAVALEDWLVVGHSEQLLRCAGLQFLLVASFVTCQVQPAIRSFGN